MEQAVGIASMVNSDKLQMSIIAQEVERELGITVEIGGAEVESAILGALTTLGTDRPLAILDLGAGSTDAFIIDSRGQILAVHLAGVGDMVTMLINSELGLENHHLAEGIKRVWSSVKPSLNSNSLPPIPISICDLVAFAENSSLRIAPV